MNVGPENARRTPGIFSEFGASESRLGQVLHGHFAQALLAEQGQVNRGGQREERFVGADVRSGFLAADVLLAGGERQHEAAAAFRVGRSVPRGGPGSCRTNFSRVAITPTYGPP